MQRLAGVGDGAEEADFLSGGFVRNGYGDRVLMNVEADEFLCFRHGDILPVAHFICATLRNPEARGK